MNAYRYHRTVAALLTVVALVSSLGLARDCKSIASNSAVGRRFGDAATIVPVAAALATAASAASGRDIRTAETSIVGSMSVFATVFVEGVTVEEGLTMLSAL